MESNVAPQVSAARQPLDVNWDSLRPQHRIRMPTNHRAGFHLPLACIRAEELEFRDRTMRGADRAGLGAFSGLRGESG